MSTTKSPSRPRCAAFVGPYLSGKTSLLESILSLTGAITRKGSVREGNTAGDGSAEARAELIAELGLPKKLTADGLLDVLNAVTTREEFLKMP